MSPTTFEDGPLAASLGDADAVSGRTAVAGGRVLLGKEAIERIKDDSIGKGDVLVTARVAGVMAAKQASLLIPTCQGVLLSGIDIEFEIDEAASAVDIRAYAKASGSTGVGMEALTAASVEALTSVDKCKSLARDASITDLHLIANTGGHSGAYRRSD